MEFRIYWKYYMLNWLLSNLQYNSRFHRNIGLTVGLGKKKKSAVVLSPCGVMRLPSSRVVIVKWAEGSRLNSIFYVLLRRCGVQVL